MKSKVKVHFDNRGGGCFGRIPYWVGAFKGLITSDQVFVCVNGPAAKVRIGADTKRLAT